MSIPGDYLERLYAGFLGKNVGIRLGAPVEAAIWTYERIREIYGDVSQYLKPYRNFAADDDANGPVYFVRPLLEASFPSPLRPEDVGKAWLDYAREGRGMFWWGGYGVSTEHTAYLNLKSGIGAPESGSIARNGPAVAEQIGGQIFVDTWGLLWPCRPDEAAGAAATAASVSHDGLGLDGARFVAACIASAFVPSAGKDLPAAMRCVVEEGIARVTPGSTYETVARSVIEFHDRNPSDWRHCQEYLMAQWGYDRYPGLCHIIPNAGVCVLALMYGRGDFSRTVEIATMCGWDTDCNAGNVGTIAGVLGGIDSIPSRYRDPINDTIVLSGLPGALNILDIPTFSRRLAAVGYGLAGEKVPESIARALERGDGERGYSFDFTLPGSTHGMRVSDPVGFAAVHRHLAKAAPGGRSSDIEKEEGEAAVPRGDGSAGVLEFRFERLQKEGRGKLFWKPFYRRADFDDERYSPVFSPVARPGQEVRIVFRMESWEGEQIGVLGYVRDSFSGKDIETTVPVFPEQGVCHELSFTVPSVGGGQVDEAGLVVVGYSRFARRDSGRLLVERFEIGGKARYSIDIRRQAIEFGSVTPFSHDGGRWTIEDGRMHLMSPGPAGSWTGGYRVADQRLSASVTPLAGESHLLFARSPGAMRGYCGGFEGEGKLAILCKDFRLETLAERDFPWEKGKTYTLVLEAIGETISLSVDGVALLEAKDGRHSSGMVGCGCTRSSRGLYGPFEVEEL